jgi:hypothetical protein
MYFITKFQTAGNNPKTKSLLCVPDFDPKTLRKNVVWKTEVDLRIILDLILKKQGGKVYARFI